MWGQKGYTIAIKCPFNKCVLSECFHGHPTINFRIIKQ